MDCAAHWNERYESIGTDRVSWYERRPTVSLELLAELGVGPEDSIVDIGGGASTLVDHLLHAGHRDLAVLDLSAVALAAAQSRVGRAARVGWIEADVRTWEPARQWDVWHDRAVLHFLIDDADRTRYALALRRAVRPDGAIVIGAFAEDGPSHCSALPVRRHAPSDLVELLGDIDVIDQRRQVHSTPGGAVQAFNWLAARLRPDSTRTE